MLRFPKVKELIIQNCIAIEPISVYFEPILNLNLEILRKIASNKLCITDVLNVINLLYPNIRDLRFQAIKIDSHKKSQETLQKIANLKNSKKLDVSMDPLLSELVLNNIQLTHSIIRHLLIMVSWILFLYIEYHESISSHYVDRVLK